MLAELFHSLKRHQFFTLSAGVIASQILSFAFMPLLTRLYPITSFGYFAIYLAAVNLIGSFSTLRLEFTIPIAQDEGEANELSSIASAFSLVAGASVAALFAFSAFRALLPTMTQDGFTWFLTAVSAMLMGWIQVLSQRIVRNGRFKFTAIRHIVDKIIFIAGSLLAVHLGYISNGLILAQSLGTLLGVAVLFYGAGWLPSLHFATARALAKKYSDFPRLNTAAMALNLWSVQLPTLVYSGFFSAEAIGLMNLAQRLADAPTTIVTSALGTVYNRRILNVPRGQLPRIFRRTLLWNILGFVLPAIVVGLFAGPIIRFLFGAKWEPSVPFFWVIVPLTIGRLSYMLQQSLTIVLRRLDVDLKVSALVVVCQGVGVVVGLKMFSTLLGPVALASLLSAAAYLVGVFWLFRLSAQCAAQPRP